MSTPVFLGLDPGASGGVARLGDGIPPLAHAWPETERETAELLKSLVTGDVEPVAVIEAVHSMPGQGVASTFKFGKHLGLLRGLLIAYEVPFVEVAPQKWQKALECLSHGDKNITKARAQQLFPTLKVGHSTADALLIATYCARQDWKGVRL